MKLRRRQREAAAIISKPDDDTTIDPGGAVRSVQSADLDMPEHDLQELWSPTNLERLARTYWWYLSRISLGLIRVHYREDERAVVFLCRPFVLLRFHAPEYELDPGRGVVRWRIRDGLLVARDNDGFLEIDVRRLPQGRPGHGRMNVEVEVANFYPALARPFKWFYTNTQSRVHVIVTHGFLKRLARMELEQSAVGRFAEVPAGAPPLIADGANGRGPQRAPGSEPEDVLVGSTPWGVVAALAAAAAVMLAALAWILRARL